MPIPVPGLAAYAAYAVRRQAARAFYNRFGRHIPKYLYGAAAAAAAATTIERNMPRNSVPPGAQRKRKASRQVSRPKKRRNPTGAGSARSAFGRKYGPAVKKPVVATEDGGGAVTTSTVVSRRSRARVDVAKTLVKASTQTTIHRFSQLPTGMGNHGNNWCSVSTGYTTGVDAMPLYMYDLTSVPNVGNAGTILSSIVCWRMLMTQATGGVTWSSQLGYGAAGATNSSFQVESAPGVAGAIGNAPGSKWMFRWAQIGLALYGTTTRYTKFQVQLVQLTDADLDPTAAAGVKYNAFWASQVKPLVSHPLAQDVHRNRLGGMKVLKSYTVELQPTENNGNDAIPDIRVVKWFHREDKVMRYDQQDANVSGTAAEYSAEQFNPEFSQTTGLVAPRKKLWLLVKALDLISAVSGSEAYSIQPSFDVIIRTRNDQLG